MKLATACWIASAVLFVGLAGQCDAEPADDLLTSLDQIMHPATADSSQVVANGWHAAPGKPSRYSGSPVARLVEANPDEDSDSDLGEGSQVTADVEAVADKPSAAQQKAPPAVAPLSLGEQWDNKVNVAKLSRPDPTWGQPFELNP